MESRVERAVANYGVAPEKAEEEVRRADKRRASYYNYYATSTWGDVNNYDLCVDTAGWGLRARCRCWRDCVALLEKKK